MRNYRLLILLSFLLILGGCAPALPTGSGIPGYNLSRPNQLFTLPDTLREISGLAVIDQETIACVQDENGIIFLYDAIKNKISKQYNFHLDGDYEGITRVGDTLYVLRSDGSLFEIDNYLGRDFTVKQYITGIPADNNEGLCYDQKQHRLLIACKGKIARGPAYKDQRVIYGFDLKQKQLSDKPVFEFDLNVIKQFVLENELVVPVKKKKKGTVDDPIIRLRTSAIAIHPHSGKLFLLSAADYMLFIFNSDGTPEYIEKLDPGLFNKAEGISFFANGDMLITNEGQDRKPSLLRFNYSDNTP
ncbi:MAG: hypothetical protein U0T82_05970 [Bacteroidales bacterium]